MSSWIYTTFKPYCERMKIKLLKDDLLFIQRVLPNIPFDRQKHVMRDYTKLWLNAENEAKGRFKANQFLSQFDNKRLNEF